MNHSKSLSINNRFLLEGYKHQIRFRIDSDAPKEYFNRFLELKNILDYDYKIKIQYLKQIIDNCVLEGNRNLPILNRCEGGLGGDSNLNNKQIRFSEFTFKRRNLDNKNDIILNVYDSDVEKWTYE
jgi:hypothetical protein